MPTVKNIPDANVEYVHVNLVHKPSADDLCGTPLRIVKEVELDLDEWRAFSRSPSSRFDWLTIDSARTTKVRYGERYMPAIRVVAPGGSTIIVELAGYDHARYAARIA